MHLNQYLAKVDIAVFSTNAEQSLLDHATARQVMKQRRSRPLFVIDICLPRNVDKKVGDVENLYLYNLEDLKEVVKQNITGRIAEIKKAENIISDEVRLMEHALKQQRYHAPIVKLRSHIEKIIDEEFNRLCASHPAFSSENNDQLLALEKAKRSIVNKLIANPAAYLKSGADKEKVEMLLQAFANEDQKSEEVSQEYAHRN